MERPCCKLHSLLPVSGVHVAPDSLPPILTSAPSLPGRWELEILCLPCKDLPCSVLIRHLHFRVLLSFALHFSTELEVSPSNGFLGECRHEGVRQLSLGDILSLKIWIWASYLLLPNCADEITVILLFSLLSTNRAHPSLNLPHPALQVRVEESIRPRSPGRLSVPFHGCSL